MSVVQEHVEYLGKWWIESRERSWSGRFTFTPEQGGMLELHGAHGDFPEPPSPDELTLMFGETIDGKAITLAGCVQTRASSHNPGGVEVDFDVRFALVGAWFDSLDEIAFDRFDFRLSGLDEWAGVSGFDVTHEADRTTISYAAPQPILLAAAQDVSLRLDFSGGGLTMTNPLLAVELSQKTRMSLRSESPLPLERLVERLHQVRNFFCFAARLRVDLSDVKTVVEVDVLRGGEVVRKQPAMISVFYRTDAVPQAPQPQERRRMLFRLEDCPDAVAEHPLTNWLAQNDFLGPVYDLYLLGLYAPRTHVEFVYLSLTEGLEALHSRKFPHYDLPKDGHAARMKAILESAPPEWRDWLADRLGPSNKATFRAGLRDLVATLPPTLIERVGDADSFTQLVSWTRNYLTHWTPALEQKAAKGEKLVKLTFALRLVLEALLMLEVGFSRNDIERLYADNHAIQRDLRYAFAP